MRFEKDDRNQQKKIGCKSKKKKNERLFLMLDVKHLKI